VKRARQGGAVARPRPRPWQGVDMADRSLIVVVAVLLVGSVASALHYMESRTPTDRPPGVEARIQEVQEMTPEVTREPSAEDLGRAYRFRIESESVPLAAAPPTFRYTRRVRGMKPFLRTEPTPGS